MLTFLPGATITGLAGVNDIGASLAGDAKTVILNTKTGERVPHFAELDYATDDDSRRAFLLRPVVPLAEGTRHIVAVRGVVNAKGDVLSASDAFAAIRAGEESERRAAFDDLFTRLESLGWARDEVQIAWDFVTASTESSTRRLLAMRDKAIDDVEDNGIEVIIIETIDEFSDDIYRRVRGNLQVPSFVDSDLPGARLNLDDDDLPVLDGTVSVPFTLLIPRVALEAPVPVALVGHGLLTTRAQVEYPSYQRFANVHGFALAAVDWQGMSAADQILIYDILRSGEFERFATVPDRLHQALINFLALGRALQGPLRSDDATRFDGATLIAEDPITYCGSSQGGIFGATLLAIDPDLPRGVLDVAGQPYSLMLTRSEEFDTFLGLLKSTYEDPRDIQLMIALAQQLWDRVEPSAYSRHLVQDPLPGVPAKDVLITLAIGDHLVPTISGHIMARAIGTPLIGPPNREPWGLDVISLDEAAGIGLLEYDFGLPLEPEQSVPMTQGDDPHGVLRQLSHYQQMRATFLSTGKIEPGCDGPCDPF
jgi:pimeloyl-ACP methyl ester carboxylesterase